MIETHWICQTCKQPIAEGEAGFVEIINCNANLGPVGAYPVEATPSLKNETGAMSLGDAAAQYILRKPNIGFLVFHLTKCDPHPNDEGYSIPVDRAQTLEEWCGWVLHVFEKTWMGRDDLERMLEFWWAHKGEDRPSS